MLDVLYYLMILAVAGGAGALGYAALTGSLPALSSLPLLGNKADRRLEVVDNANVDGKRRLLLVRRDNVEHLIMTGGPVDVVIETGIGQPAPARRSAEIIEAPVAVYARPARRFGQAVGE